MDENNKPVSGARIRISRSDRLVQEAISDTDGLYHSNLLDEAIYHIDVVANGKSTEAKNLSLNAGSGKKYYIIKVLGDKVVIDGVDEDPYLSLKLQKIRDADYRTNTIIDGPHIGSYHLTEPKETGANNDRFFIYNKNDSLRKIQPGETVK